MPFVLHTDASGVGLGAVLLQETPEGLSTIQYASRALSAAERKYSTVERELLAIIWAVEKFRPYLEVGHFKVYSDQKSLQWVRKARDPTGRLARWVMRLQPFDFTIIYHAGKLNAVADALSRNLQFEEAKTVVSAIVCDVVMPSNADMCEAQNDDEDLQWVKRLLADPNVDPQLR